MVVSVALALLATTTAVWSLTVPPTQGPAENGQPAWFLQGSFPDAAGFTLVDADGHITVVAREAAGAGAPAADSGPPCSHSSICGRRDGKARGAMQRVQWKQELGYTFSYPYVVPKGLGGIPSVALDSKGNLWVYKRSPPGTPQLYKFDSNHKLILTVGDDVIGHQDKAHGMAVDAHDNVWITDNGQATVMELSSQGRLLKTIGTRGRRGDWDESKGQRLLWQPVMVAFAPNGDLYIAEGHANESPNDVDSDDPVNKEGVARVIHLHRDGKFVNQWFGNEVGNGKFDSTHGFAIDPTNGDVWIGDREQYRIVIYNANGDFLKTLQTRNLVCALHFDAEGNPWMASGQDGQFLKLDRNGRVLGAIGNGMGIGPGQFIEASYWVFDRHDNLYAGDTGTGRVTIMTKPSRP
jgi:sugar lactone lactonase YvrE